MKSGKTMQDDSDLYETFHLQKNTLKTRNYVRLLNRLQLHAWPQEVMRQEITSLLLLL